MSYAQYHSHIEEMQHSVPQERKWNPGVFIDIDGVVLTGGKPFEFSKEAIHDLWNNQIPFMFFTNGTYSAKDLVASLRKIFDLPFTNDHVVVAPSPCSSLTDYHDKRVLIVGQEDSLGLVEELGFNDFITIEDLADLFPDLDFVDHKKRKQLLATPMTAELKKAQEEFRPIDLILILGEPVNWECSLQLLIDVLMTNGDPRDKFKFVPEPHLPIIACNKDVTFKGSAMLPRFGNGAFLECLEALYMKITKKKLVYEAIMGKPYLIQYKFAAEQIQRLSPNGKPINKFYIIGDNPEVDIKGANVFLEHLNSENPKSASMLSHRFRHHSVRQSQVAQQPVESILVCTGVYNPQNDLLYHVRRLFSHSQLPKSRNQSTRSEMLLDSDERMVSNESDEDDCLVAKPEEEPEQLNENELNQALSTKNSFISYFEDKFNLPDHTFDNIRHSVDYILKQSGL